MPFLPHAPSLFNIHGRLATKLGEQVAFERIQSLRQALFLSRTLVANNLRRRLAGLEVEVVLQQLLDTAEQTVIVLASSAATGAMLGAGIGAFGLGAGAVPGALGGGVLGLKAGAWILSALGLGALTEDVLSGLPKVLASYQNGIATAWRTPRPQHSPFDTLAEEARQRQAIADAARHFAQGHETLVVLLLSAIVAYLTRNRGDSNVLTAELRASPLGGKFAAWAIKHEEALKRHPDLQRMEARVHSNTALGSESRPTPDRSNGTKAKDERQEQNDKKAGIGEYREHHLNRVDEIKDQLADQGYRVSNKELSFGDSCGMGRCRPDIVAEAPDGRIRIIEVKTGDSDLSIRQSEIFPQIRDGSSIPKGKVAEVFGLAPGIPLKDQGYPDGIPIEIVKSPGLER